MLTDGERTYNGNDEDKKPKATLNDALSLSALAIKSQAGIQSEPVLPKAE